MNQRLATIIGILALCGPIAFGAPKPKKPTPKVEKPEKIVPGDKPSRPGAPNSPAPSKSLPEAPDLTKKPTNSDKSPSKKWQPLAAFPRLQQYKLSNYRATNLMLRGGSITKSDSMITVGGQTIQKPLSEVKSDLKALGKELEGLPRYEGERVFRATSLGPDLRKQLAVNKEWKDGGFVSTSHANSAGDWVKQSGFVKKSNTIMDIDLPKGGTHSGVNIDAPKVKSGIGGPAEREVLFHAGQRFKVVKVVEGRNAVAKELGQSTGADFYVKLQALPFTKAHADDFAKRVDTIQ